MTTSVDEILNGPDYFFCEKYAARWKKTYCLELQDGAKSGDLHLGRKIGSMKGVVSTHGLKHGNCVICAQGARIRQELNNMKKGDCVNCLRKGVSIMAKDLCTTCYPHRKDKKKLAEIRKRFEQLHVVKKPEKQAAPAPAPPVPGGGQPLDSGSSSITIKPDVDLIVLYFAAGDSRLYPRLLELARRERRQPEDQLMILIERATETITT